MKIAITGASGFIGQNVIKELKQQKNIEITAVVHKKNMDDSNLRIVPLDIYNLNEIDNIYVYLGKPDVLIHLAWGGLPNYKSLHHIEAELPNQYNFLSRTIKEGLPSLLVAGTCLEYGMQCGPLDESMEAKPVTPYGYAKNALRCQLEFLQKQIPFKLTWMRLFYVYGEGQSAKSIYIQLKTAAENGAGVFNMSGGEQLRDYLSINELTRYLTEITMLNKATGIVNVSSGHPVSIRTLVESWIKENNWHIFPNIGYYPYLDYEPLAFWGVNFKLKKLLHASLMK